MVSIILGMGLGVCSLSQAQMAGVGGGTPTIPGTDFGGATDPSSIQAGGGLRVVPSIQISERYDSNVFYAPKSLLRGVTPSDFVTTVAPQVRGLYADRQGLVKVNAVVGAVGSYYVNNTELSYVGANAGVVLNMNDLVSRWRPGARWTVSDTYFYTPQPPAFFLGDQSAIQANPFVAGFQAVRTNTNSNSVNTTFQLPIYKQTHFVASYTNSFIRYGASRVPLASPLISQNIQAYTAGLLVETSIQDTVRIDFTGNEFDIGERGAFSARGITLDWNHTVSPTVGFNTTAGAQVLSGELNGIPLNSLIAPFGGLGIHWISPTTSMALSYRSSIIPSFQFQGAAMLAHSMSFSMTQETPITDVVGLLQANGGVANDYGSSSASSISWTTVGGSAGLLYRATQKTFLSLIYTYQNIDNVFGTTHFAYDRHDTQLSLTQAFY